MATALETTDTHEASDLFDGDPAGRILRIAAELISAKGFDATSMSMIAEAAKLTKAGLYYYVKGKKELLFKITSLAMDLLERHVVEPARSEQDAEQRLSAIVRAHAQLLTHETGALAILTDEVAALEPGDRQVIIARKRAYYELLRDTLTELAAEGKLRPVEPTVAAFSLLGMVMWIARWYDPEGSLPRHRVAGEIAAMARGAVLANPESGNAAPPFPKPNFV